MSSVPVGPRTPRPVAVVPGAPDPRLEKLYRYWSSKRKGRRMPSRANIDPVEIPVDIWPHTMLLDVLWHDGVPRFRYRRAGAVFWRASGPEPTSRFIEEVLPETAGDRASVIDIYTQMATCQSALYSENIFALDGQVAPMVSQHMSLPLSTDGGTVDMALAGHVFEHNTLPRDRAFARVCCLHEVARVVLDN